MHRVDGHFVRLAGALLLAASLLGPAARAEVRNTEPPLQHIEVNRFDRKALRTGALFFMYDCLSCHSVQGARFSELTGQLNLSAKQVQEYLNTTARRVGQTMKSSMPPKIAEQFMHKAPPDLTVIAKRGAPCA